jgi:hypothetical protein
VYSDVVRGIVNSLGPLGLDNVLDYEPASIATAPMAYLFLRSWTRSQQGGVVTMRYEVVVRLVLLWSQNDTAEQQLQPLVNALPAAVEVDMTLGAGQDDRRISQVTMGVAEYRDIGGTFYRTMDVTVSVLEKGAANSGL